MKQMHLTDALAPYRVSDKYETLTCVCVLTFIALCWRPDFHCFIYWPTYQGVSWCPCCSPNRVLVAVFDPLFQSQSHHFLRLLLSVTPRWSCKTHFHVHTESPSISVVEYLWPQISLFWCYVCELQALANNHHNIGLTPGRKISVVVGSWL